jgi:hypothetical protein
MPHSVPVACSFPRCPKTFNALLDWLKQVWAEEPFPDHIHSRGVFELSALGAPAMNHAFTQHIERPSGTDQDGYFLTPLNAALEQISHGHPLAARNIWAVIRVDFDWKAIAARGGWAQEMYAMYLSRAIEDLWWQYKMAPH